MGSVPPFTGDVDFDHLIKIVPPEILQCKTTHFSPLLLIAILGGDSLRL